MVQKISEMDKEMKSYDEILKHLFEAEEKKKEAKQNNDLQAYLDADKKVNKLKIILAEWDGDWCCLNTKTF